MFWEDPLRCHWDGLTLPQSKYFNFHSFFVSLFVLLRLGVALFIFLGSVYILHHPPCEFWSPSFLRSAQRWMQSTAPSACWLPVPRGCRWSAVRRRPRILGPLQWTTNSSLSRSSSAPTTSPRPPSNWSPSPLVRRNSDLTSAWTDGEWRGRENRSMHEGAKRDGRGF